MPSRLRRLVSRPHLLIAFFGAAVVILAAAELGHAQGRLERIEVHKGWFGGPPTARIAVTGEFYDSKTNAYYYRVKAVVRRSPGDSNGSTVLLKAKNWGAAFDQLDRRSRRYTGWAPGFLRDTIVKTFNFTPADLRERFPPLTSRFSYVIDVAVDNFDLRVNNAGGRRAKGPRSFVEPLSVGLPAGTHEISVLSCVWPDEAHPIVRPFARFIRVADKASTAISIGVPAVALLAGGPGGALAVAIGKSLGKHLAKNFIVNTATCSSAVYSLEVLAKVPPLRGLDVDDAERELTRRRLKMEVDHQVVERNSCTNVPDAVTSQNPRPGKRLRRGETVSVSVRFCRDKGGPSPASWTGTWSGDYGPIVLIQTGNRVKGCYRRENSTITGTIKGNVLDGTWTNREGGGDNTGPLKFTLKGNGFSGGWAYGGKVGPGNSNAWTGTRVSSKTDSSGICDMP